MYGLFGMLRVLVVPGTERGSGAPPKRGETASPQGLAGTQARKGGERARAAEPELERLLKSHAS